MNDKSNPISQGVLTNNGSGKGLVTPAAVEVRARELALIAGHPRHVRAGDRARALRELSGGALVSWIVGALKGAVVVGGLSALGAGLFSLGIPQESILRYETGLKADKFVLLAHGTAAEVADAREILARTELEALDHHELGQPVSVSSR